MVRYTHLETDGDSELALKASGHHILLRRRGEGEQSNVCSESETKLDRDRLTDLIALLFVTVLTFIFRVGCAIVAIVIVTPVVEVLCILGAAVLCGAGAIGQWVSGAAATAGTELRHRSLVLCIYSRVRSVALHKLTSVSTSSTLARDEKKSCATARAVLRGSQG